MRELNSLQDEMNRLFGRFFDAPVADGQPLRRWIPAMDLVETPDQFVLRADLPGISEKDVKIELENNVLTVSGERKSEHESKGEGFYRVERASGAFSRSLTLPEGVDPDQIDARFDKGVLEVRIPKPEQRKPHRVAINVDGSARTIEGTASASEAETAVAVAAENSGAPAGATS
jgi:HSP20 family protein